MKWRRVVALAAIGILMISTSVAAEGIYFENEGYLVPSENSRSAFDPVLAQSGGSEDVVPDAAGFPDIVVTATIRDADGNPVPDLGPEDIVLTEQSENETEAVQQSPTCFEAIGGETGTSFALAFDVSYSMSADNKLVEAKAAAGLFLDAAEDLDQGALVSFAGCRQVETPFPLAPIDLDADGDNVPDIRQRIDELTALGSTAVYDGIARAVAALDGAGEPKGVVALTDGMTNNDCGDTINSVIEKARAANVPVYTIGLAIPPDSTMAQNLSTIAEQTGGTFSLAPAPEDLADIYLRIAGAIRARYRICYTTHNPALDGTTRTVTVRFGDTAGAGTYSVGTGPGNQPPTIEHDPVARATENTPVTIAARIVDPDPGDTIRKASLFYREQADGPDALFTEIDMTPGAGEGNYTVEVPQDQVRVPGSEYYISAWDAGGARADSGSEQRPYVIEVQAGGPAENGPPEIEHVPVVLAARNTPVAIEARITDPDPDDAVARAVLYFRPHHDGPDAPYTESAMAAAEDGMYTTEIPQEYVTEPGLDYYISAWDENDARADSGSPADPYVIRVSAGPVADAGPDQTVDENARVTLDGSASLSAIPEEAPAYSWRQTMGPVVSLQGAATARPTFEAPVVDRTGTVLIFELTVTNRLGAADSDTVWVTIEKDPGCGERDCGSGSGGCFIDTASDAPGWLRRLVRSWH